jgi:monoamine oxidase
VIGKIFQDARLSKAKQKAIREQSYSRTAKVFLRISPRPKGGFTSGGEHTSAWTGWMQGALESGRRVVREING